MATTQQPTPVDANKSVIGNMTPVPLHFGGIMIEWQVVMNGYLVPPLLIFTLVINILFCIVLLKPNMRSPTNVLLVAMAVSDTLTGLSPVPSYVYMYTLGHYTEWAPFAWCHVSDIIQRSLPTVFHTASIWLTVALASQRYFYVCHSLWARKWCTINNMLKAIVVIYALSSIVHISTFIDTFHTPYETKSKRDENRTILSCLRLQTQWFRENQTIYYNVYIWFRIVFIHVIPCASLVVLNALLIRTMREAKRRRAQLLKQNKKSESRKLKDSSSTTQMMILVVGVFLVVEIPAAAYLLFYAIWTTAAIGPMNPHVSTSLTLILNFFILLSYPVTFFIYCGMSRQFRDIFKRLFLPASGGASLAIEREHSHYTTLPDENGRGVENNHNVTTI